MAATLNNIEIAPNAWVDLYDVTGLPVGTAIEVDNLGDTRVLLTVSAGEPALSFSSYNILHPHSPYRLRNSTNDPGAWAACRQGAGGLVNVRVVPT